MFFRHMHVDVEQLVFMPLYRVVDNDTCFEGLWAVVIQCKGPTLLQPENANRRARKTEIRSFKSKITLR